MQENDFSHEDHARPRGRGANTISGRRRAVFTASLRDSVPERASGEKPDVPGTPDGAHFIIPIQLAQSLREAGGYP